MPGDVKLGKQQPPAKRAYFPTCTAPQVYLRYTTPIDLPRARQGRYDLSSSTLTSGLTLRLVRSYHYYTQFDEHDDGCAASDGLKGFTYELPNRCRPQFIHLARHRGAVPEEMVLSVRPTAYLAPKRSQRKLQST